MFSSVLNNCQENVDELLLTISNVSELDMPQLNPSTPNSQEYPKEALNRLEEANFMLSLHFSVVDVELIAYISATL